MAGRLQRRPGDAGSLHVGSDERQDARAGVGNQRRSGPAKLIRAEAVASDAVTVVIEDRWGQRWRLQLNVDRSSPPAITALTPTPVWPPEIPVPERMSWPELEAALEAKLAHDAAKGWFTGAVLVSQRGRTLFQARAWPRRPRAALANSLGHPLPHGIDEQDDDRRGGAAAGAGGRPRAG